MFKKLIMIGVFVISVVAMSGTHANAQFFDGWGWFGFSAIEGNVKVVDIPTPGELSLTSGAIAVVTATLTSRTIEVVCESKGKKRVVTQFPSLFKSADTEQITTGGEAMVQFRFVLPGGEPDGEVDLSSASATFNPTCGIFGGTLVQGSGALRTMSITMQSFLCASGTPHPSCGGGDLQLSSKSTQPTPVDTVRLACGRLKIARDSFGIPIHGQEFTCFEFNGDDDD